MCRPNRALLPQAEHRLTPTVPPVRYRGPRIPHPVHSRLARPLPGKVVLTTCPVCALLPGSDEVQRAIPLPMSKQEETRDRVLDLVESLVVGQPIPAERQLAVDLGVSRLTVRAALDELVRDG